MNIETVDYVEEREAGDFIDKLKTSLTFTDSEDVTDNEKSVVIINDAEAGFFIN